MMNPPDRIDAAAYRGRIAPTPTGLLHAGHASTFLTAFQRARDAQGVIFLRIEDLDPARCRSEFVEAALDDLKWLGINWHGEPLFQSARRDAYLAAWRQLLHLGLIYPCSRSRKDVASAGLAPHDEEPVFPPEWRVPPPDPAAFPSPAGINWRFRVPDGRKMGFHDGRLGFMERIALRDFGDFLVWNRDDVPSYELAVVVDDIFQGITEVVRGEDLVTSTARQLLLYEAFRATPPAFFHCPLVRDASGKRLAKRSPGRSLRDFRAGGFSPDRMARGFV